MRERGGGRQRNEERSSRSCGTWGTRSSAATMIPGIEKRLTTAAQIATQLLDFGKEHRFSSFLPFSSPFSSIFLSRLFLSVLTLSDSDERENGDEESLTTGKEWRWGKEGKSDARSVKKFHRSEPRQLLNLAVTKRTKGVVGIEDNEVTDYCHIELLSQEIRESNCGSFSCKNINCS